MKIKVLRLLQPAALSGDETTFFAASQGHVIELEGHVFTVTDRRGDQVCVGLHNASFWKPMPTEEAPPLPNALKRPGTAR